MINQVPRSCGTMISGCLSRRHRQSVKIAQWMLAYAGRGVRRDAEWASAKLLHAEKHESMLS